MKHLKVLSLVGLAFLSLELRASAAVFRLNGAQFNISNAGTTGYAVGAYTVSGEFKRDTTSGNSGALTAWNISLNGPSGYTFNWVKNTSGYADNSTTFITSGNRENVVNFYAVPAVTGRPFLELTFSNDFDSVYNDPTVGTPGSYPLASTGKTSLTAVEIQQFGNADAVEASVLGQADFVPFAPSMLFFLPLLSAYRRIRKQWASL
jgi:hypothetical protein